jgi:hypothetical protein
MSVLNNLKSTLITNRDATPKVLTDSYISGGEIKESEGYVLTGAADQIASTYRLCQVPSNARVCSLDFQSSGCGSAAQVDVCVFYPTFIPVGAGLVASQASQMINTTLFGTNVACSSAVAATNLITTANIAINVQEQPLWQAAGLTSDPMIDLDLGLYVTGSTSAAGYVSLKARYML